MVIGATGFVEGARGGEKGTLDSFLFSSATSKTSKEVSKEESADEDKADVDGGDAEVVVILSDDDDIDNDEGKVGDRMEEGDDDKDGGDGGGDKKDGDVDDDEDGWIDESPDLGLGIDPLALAAKAAPALDITIAAAADDDETLSGHKRKWPLLSPSPSR